MDKIKQLKKALKLFLKYCKNEKLILLDKYTNITVNYDCFNNHFYTFNNIFSLEMCGNRIKVFCIFEDLTFYFDEQDNIDYMLDSIVSSFTIARNYSDLNISSLEF